MYEGSQSFRGWAYVFGLRAGRPEGSLGIET